MAPQGGITWGGIAMGALATLAVMVLIFPIALYAYGIADALSPGGGGGGSYDSGSYDAVAGVGGIDVMIT